MKAALALLRKNRPTPSPAIDPDQLDPFTTPVKGSRAGSRMGEKGAGESGADGGEEVGLEWGMRSMAVVVEGAKRSGEWQCRITGGRWVKGGRWVLSLCLGNPRVLNAVGAWSRPRSSARPQKPALHRHRMERFGS